jgi:hypothetical protein
MPRITALSGGLYAYGETALEEQKDEQVFGVHKYPATGAGPASNAIAISRWIADYPAGLRNFAGRLRRTLNT